MKRKLGTLGRISEVAYVQVLMGGWEVHWVHSGQGQKVLMDDRGDLKEKSVVTGKERG